MLRGSLLKINVSLKKIVPRFVLESNMLVSPRTQKVICGDNLM